MSATALIANRMHTNRMHTGFDAMCSQRYTARKWRLTNDFADNLSTSFGKILSLTTTSLCRIPTSPVTRTKKIVLWTVSLIVGLPIIAVGSLLLWMHLSDRTNGTLVSSGITRRYLLYVPARHDSSKPAPLVISLHPAASWPSAEMRISGWNRLADQHDFLVVYPAGRDFPQVWPMSPKDAAIDAQFISDLIDQLQSIHRIDPARIYVDGISNGGAMAFAVSCRLPSRIAAVGAVAAAEAIDFDWCGAAAPVPMMAFHGTADHVAPYGGGTSGDPVNPRQFPAIRDWVARWARRNHCAHTPVETGVTPKVRRLSYPDCPDNADVVLYTVDGGGHTWPGEDDLAEWIVGPATHEISATQLLWEFYMQHPRKRE